MDLSKITTSELVGALFELSHEINSDNVKINEIRTNKYFFILPSPFMGFILRPKIMYVKTNNMKLGNQKRIIECF